MGISKGLLLGSAAAAVAMTAGTAFAADLPSRKAAPVAYVKICDVYGRGFYYIPGTNTCLKVGGRVRVEYGYRRAQNTRTIDFAGALGGTTAARRFDTLGWRARAYVNMDARSQTAWGTVQTVFSIAIRSRSGIFNGGGANVGAAGNATATTQVYAAYIRFAGFTFGRAPHTFSSGPGFLFYQTNWSGGGAIGALQLTYTAVFGGGFSASISLQDKNDFANQRGAWLGGAGAGAPNRLPNLVLTLRVDQGWGHLRVSGAVGSNINSNTVVTRSKTGWAVGADARIKLPSLSRGSSLWLSVRYANGLNEYATGGNSPNGSIAKDARVTGGLRPATMLNVASNAACNTPGGACVMQNSKALSAMIAFSHRWSPTLRSNFALSYAKYTPAAMIRANGFPTSTSWQGAVNLIWSPTRGFDIGLEVYYAKIRNSGITAGNRALLATSGVSANPSDLGVKMRVQRTF